MRADTAVKTRAEVFVSDYVRSVYNWMGIGLALTGFVAYYVSSNESLIRLIFGNPLLLMVLIVAELGLVFGIVGMVNRMSAGTATALFRAQRGSPFFDLSGLCSGLHCEHLLYLRRHVHCLQYLRVDDEEGLDVPRRFYDDGSDRHHHCHARQYVH